jgi:hypothetical protein
MGMNKNMLCRVPDANTRKPQTLPSAIGHVVSMLNSSAVFWQKA